MHDDGVHALVLRAKTGDEAAWRTLHAQMQPYLLRVARQALGPDWPQKSVSDLLQGTWERAWQGIGQFRGGDDDEQTAALLRAWLARILKNVRSNDRRFDDAVRRKAPPGEVRLDGGDSTAPGVEPVSPDPTPSAELHAEDRRNVVQAALQHLPDEMDREIVRLRFFEDLSLAQIAKRLDLSYDNVRDRFHDSLKRLEPHLQKLQG
jgi:RNA polymerase sigma factor (sigma-70 family)